MEAEENMTLVEDDVFEDIDMQEFYSQMINTYNVLTYMDYFTETFKLILCTFVLVTDIYLVIMILRNPKLRNKTNMYILHYAIWHSVLMISTELLFKFLSITSLDIQVPDFIYYFAFDMERLSLIFVFHFGFGIGLDWLINVHKPELAERYAKLNNWMVILLYVSAFLQGILQFIFSRMDYYWHLRYVLTEILYLIILLIILIFNWMNRRNKHMTNKKSYALTVSNIIIISWLPLEIYDNLASITYGSYIMYSIVLTTIFLADWCAYSSTFLIIYTLVKQNKYFEQDFWSIFKRNVNKNHADMNELEESDDEEVDTPNSIVIS